MGWCMGVGWGRWDRGRWEYGVGRPKVVGFQTSLLSSFQSIVCTYRPPLSGKMVVDGMVD